jgi:hypothetical protein
MYGVFLTPFVPRLLVCGVESCTSSSAAPSHQTLKRVRCLGPAMGTDSRTGEWERGIMMCKSFCLRPIGRAAACRWCSIASPAYPVLPFATSPQLQQEATPCRTSDLCSAWRMGGSRFVGFCNAAMAAVAAVHMGHALYGGLAQYVPQELASMGSDGWQLWWLWYARDRTPYVPLVWCVGLVHWHPAGRDVGPD